MPKLLIFAPCDNVLITGATETMSLIVVMTGVSFPAPPADLPKDMSAPMRWFILTNWEVVEEDKGKVFEQRLRLFGNDRDYFEALQQMDFVEGKYHHRMIAGLNGFPIVPPGVYRIKLDIREKGIGIVG